MSYIPTPVAILNGGTAATTAAAAITNLGAVSLTTNQTISGICNFSNALSTFAGNAATATTAGGITGTLSVAGGGTGLATLTADNLMVGNGTGNVTFIAPSTAGNTLRSTGSAWASASTAWTVSQGGTGLATLTADNLMVGNGTGNVTFVAPGIAGSTLRSTGAAWVSATTAWTVSQGGTGLGTLTADNLLVGNGTGNVTFVAPSTAGNTLRSTGSAWVSSGSAWTVSQGGTGFATTTAYAVMCGGTTSTNPLQPIASVGTAGQVLTSNGAGALPTMQTPAGGGNPYNYCFNSQLEFDDYSVTDSTSKTIDANATHSPIGSSYLFSSIGNYLCTRWFLQPQTNSVVCTRATNTIGTSGVTSNYGRTMAPNATGKLIWGQILNSIDSIALQGKTLRVGMKLKATGYTGVVKVGLFKWNSTANVITNAIFSAAGANTVDPTWATNLSLISTAGTITASTSYQELYTTFVVPTSGMNNLALIAWTDSQLTNTQSITFTEGMIQDSAYTTWAIISNADERGRCDFYSRRFKLATSSGNETGLIGQAISTSAAVGFTVFCDGMNPEYNTSSGQYNNKITTDTGSGQLVQGVTTTAITSFGFVTAGNEDRSTIYINTGATLTTGTTYRLQGAASAPFIVTVCREL